MNFLEGENPLRPTPRTAAAAVVTALLVLAGGALIRPAPPTLSTAERGDPQLLDRARPLFTDESRDLVSIVEIDEGTTATAHFGADDDTDYELGSISKAMTALLLADAIERGEVGEDTELGQILDMEGTPAAEVTLAELASHRSGMPYLPDRLPDRVGMGVLNFLALNPYIADTDTVIDQAAAASLEGRGEFTYSNLGFAVLGHAVAEAAGTDYPSLLRERLLKPLGMDDTTLPATSSELPDDATSGNSDRGRTGVPWTVDGYAPMGGVRSTSADMERFARALLEGTAPGIQALEPRWDDGRGEEVGLGWFTLDLDGTDITWHNGIGRSFTSMILLDREAERAVVVLNNTGIDVDAEGLELIGEHS